MNDPFIEKAAWVPRPPFRCRIGFHKWQDGFSGSMMSPLARRCSLCWKTQHFVLGAGILEGYSRPDSGLPAAPQEGTPLGDAYDRIIEKQNRELRLLTERPPNLQVERLAGKFMAQVMREFPDRSIEQQENIARRCAAEEIVSQRQGESKK